MKTTIHTYSLDVRVPAEAEAYKELTARLTARGSKCFCTWGGNSHYLSQFKAPTTVELETKHLFANQWSTSCGLRVFDWAEDYPVRDTQKAFKRGHYLELTDEMRAVRHDTHACGYCGVQRPAVEGLVFCPECIGSEYLNVSDLPLTRMQAVDNKAERAELTPEELAERLPLYKTAHLHGHTARDKARSAKQRDDIEAEYKKALVDARHKFEGFTWLMDHGIKTDLAIYYNHTGRFGFGWNQPVSAEILSELLDIIAEFPFAYDIKCADGRSLRGG